MISAFNNFVDRQQTFRGGSSNFYLIKKTEEKLKH